MKFEDVVIGSYYVITGNTRIKHNHDIGEVVKATKVNIGYEYVYLVSENGLDQCLTAEDIEPVTTAFDRVKIGDSVMALESMTDNLRNIVKKGDIVVVVGKDYNDLCLSGKHNSFGTWFYMATDSNIENPFRPCVNGLNSFEIVTAPLGIKEKVVEKKSKLLYVVSNEDQSYRMSTFDREYAREVKSDLGGKKCGFTIGAYTLVKEIR